MGGAVATLCTLRLLRQLPPRDDYPLRCVAFATPSIGNGALSALVAERHWDAYLSNFLLPEDVVVQLTSPSQVQLASGALCVRCWPSEHRSLLHIRLLPPASCLLPYHVETPMNLLLICGTGRLGSGDRRARVRRAPICGGC